MQAADKSCYVTDGKKQAGLSIHNGVYRAGRPGGHDWFACGISFQNNIGKAFPMAWQHQDIHQGIEGCGVQCFSSENDARMRVKNSKSLTVDRFFFLTGAQKQQPEIRELLAEFEKGFHQLRDSLISSEAPDKAKDRCMRRDAQFASQLGGSRCPFRCRRETGRVHSIAAAKPKNQCAFWARKSERVSLFTQALADTDYAMGKIASHAFGKH